MPSYDYKNNVLNREGNLYVEEYYSSVDTKIRFNDALFPNINYIQFQIDENIKPIFGYNSAVFDDVAVGTRMVTGIFKVPVKNLEDTGRTHFDNVNYNVQILDDTYKPGWSKNINNRNGFNTRNKNKYNKVYATSNILYYSDNTKDYQKKLITKGYELSTNGYLDTKTKKAIIDYQTENLLNISGVLDQETMDSLDNNVFFNASIINDNSSIYIGPSNNYLSMHSLNKDCKVNVIGKLNGYYLIKCNGVKGYIEEDKVKMLQ